MSIKTIKTKMCPSCLHYKRYFYACEHCNIIICKECVMDLYDNKSCPDCFPREIERMINKDKQSENNKYILRFGVK